jgi:hypothetical protein
MPGKTTVAAAGLAAESVASAADAAQPQSDILKDLRRTAARRAAATYLT